LLRSAYASAIQLAIENDYTCLAFPAIGRHQTLALTRVMNFHKSREPLLNKIACGVIADLASCLPVKACFPLR
jgi:hypothetical protein